MSDHDDDKTQTHVVLTQGTLVSHYRIVEKIGAGGMGEVYLAEDTKLNRQVALKFLPAHLTSDNDLRTRFAREARAAAKLDHPNIIPIYEVGEYRRRPYFAMAHIEGDSLRDIIKKGKLSIAEAINLAKQVCEGLSEAHHAGIVHRDIKPSNIIIDSKGRARILDFGLAAVSGDEKLTKTGSTLGTVGYMSPEQLKGESVDKRTDTFAVGVILYEMISGRRLFTGDNDAAIVKAITDSTPEPLARFKSGVTDELQRIVSKALTKDRSIRYQTADGLLADLRHYAIESPRKKSNRIFLWTASIAVLIAIGYYGFTMFHQRSEGRIMLAVLPFENLGSPEDEYFADGITDEITSRLTGLKGLGVIGRTSILQYRGTTKPIDEIGQELGVDYILDGTIRWDKSGAVDKVRITPQLTRVSDETNLWVDNLQRDLSEVFEVQEEIAANITKELNIALIWTKSRSANLRSTENLKAYEFYIRGKNYLAQGKDPGNCLRAIGLFDKAIALDSNFALAYAWKAYTHTSYAFYWELRWSKHTKPARLAIKKALELQPDLGQAFWARGAYANYIETEYEEALEDFARAQRANVDEALVLSEIAVVKLRKGKWDEAKDLAYRVLELDPRSTMAASFVGEPLRYTHEWEDAEEVYDQMIEFTPDGVAPYLDKIYLQVSKGADRKAIGETLTKWSRHLTENDMLIDPYGAAYLGFFRFADGFHGLDAEITRVKFRLNDNPGILLHYYMGLLYWQKGVSDSAYKYLDSTCTLVQDRMQEFQFNTAGEYEILENDHQVFELLAISNSLIDRHDQAIKQANLAMETMPIDLCHW